MQVFIPSMPFQETSTLTGTPLFPGIQLCGSSQSTKFNNCETSYNISSSNECCRESGGRGLICCKTKFPFQAPRRGQVAGNERLGSSELRNLDSTPRITLLLLLHLTPHRHGLNSDLPYCCNNPEHLPRLHNVVRGCLITHFAVHWHVIFLTPYVEDKLKTFQFKSAGSIHSKVVWIFKRTAVIYTGNILVFAVSNRIYINW